MFVATKVLSQQNSCFVATKLVFCRNKHVFVTTKIILVPMILNTSNVTCDAKLPHCRSQAAVFYLKVQL